jgi:hypothetical protein
VARSRSRKRRPTGARRAESSGGEALALAAPEATAKARSGGRAGAAGGASNPRARAKGRRTSPAASTYGERPQAPWHPLPLSELLILVGAVGAALGMSKLSHGLSSGGPALFVGLAAVTLGTIEVSFREHRSGYRSHTLLLALSVVILCDAVLVLALTAFTTPGRLFDVVLVAVDLALFAFLFKVFRARFLDARHARVLREG